MSNSIVLSERLDDFWIYPKLSKVTDARDINDNYFDFLNTNNSNTPINLYVHIPFCESSCMFCPYYKVGKSNIKEVSEYLKFIIKEMEMYSRTKYFCGRTISSVHFGGGNPLMLGIKNLEKLVDSINKIFDIKNGSDIWSLEGSLCSINNKEYVKQLIGLGFNRMSFGIQTFNESIRNKMHIKTSLREIYHAVEVFQNVGFQHYCFDLMYNLPNQSIDIHLLDLEKVTKLFPYHIDVYNMALFPNTHLDKLVKSKSFNINPSNKNQIEMYLASHNWLMKHDYNHIISHTYSKVQKKPHLGDQLYLLNNNVLGVGVSSRSYIDGYAYKNICDMSKYYSALKNDCFPVNLATCLSVEEQYDRLMVFFPIFQKLDLSKIPIASKYEKKIETLESMGLVKKKDSNLELTEKGMLWSGNISAYFIGEKRWNAYLTSFLQSMREKTNPYNEDKMGVY